MLTPITYGIQSEPASTVVTSSQKSSLVMIPSVR